MKFKTFCFIFALLSCTSITDNEEGLIFEKLETARPIATTSTIQTSTTTTSTTLGPSEVNNRFSEIISEISPAVFIEIGKDEYFNESFSFTFEENRYDVSYNFETNEVYCGYLDFGVGEIVGMRGLEDADEGESKNITGVWLNRFTNSHIDKIIINTKASNGNPPWFLLIATYGSMFAIFLITWLLQ